MTTATTLVRPTALAAPTALAVRVPAAFFGMVLGLAGLGTAWRAATALWGLPAAVGEAIMALATITWIAVSALYAAKWAWARDVALTEWRDPVQCCFVGLAPVSTMLVALAVRPYAGPAALALAALGASGQLAFMAYRVGGLWMGGRDPLTTTPVLYLPTVAGSFVAALAAGALGYPSLGTLAFGAGLFSWFALESVILHRLLVHEHLAVALLPTLGIQLAPPVVGCVAWLGLTTGAPDRFALALLGYGLLQTLVLLRLARWIRTQPFAPSYWAFTFGAGALATAAIRIATRTELAAPGGDPAGWRWLAGGLFAGTNLVIGAVAVGTVRLALRGRLLPPVPSSSRAQGVFANQTGGAREA
ncbi:MAG TPA: dicarboxylate transporter/tellurite-resistance protein TehA [Gemmatirosa sp.]